jgi:hypothetical protein
VSKTNEEGKLQQTAGRRERGRELEKVKAVILVML